MNDEQGDVRRKRVIAHSSGSAAVTVGVMPRTGVGPSSDGSIAGGGASLAIERSSSTSSPRSYIPLQQHIHHARKRSLSSLGSSVSSHQRGRTTSSIGSSSASPGSRSGAMTGEGGHSEHASSSSARFTTNTSDFLLPQRSFTPTSPQLIVPPPSVGGSTVSCMRGEGDYAVSTTSLPLLRRAAAAAAFANANRVRLRRGSMLGREVAKDEELTSSDEDEDMDSADDERHPAAASDKSLTPPNINAAANRLLRADIGIAEKRAEGVDDDMHIETGDVSLENVKLESKSRPGTPPLHAQPHGQQAGMASPGTPLEGGNATSFAGRGGSGRRGATRNRGHYTARDRGMQRVAASLRDEARPSDSEIASEAKLQRKLAPESESLTPTTPRLLAVGARSPTSLKRPAHSTGAGLGVMERTTLDDDDLMFNDHFDPYDAADSSDEEELGNIKTTTASTAGMASNPQSMTEEEADSVAHGNGIAIPGGSAQREKLWLGFRESTPVMGSRASPGADRALGKGGRPSTATGVGLSTSFGSPLPESVMDMDVGIAQRSGTAMPSPSVWGKTSKRKLDNDRYEPYSSSLHKRRAVSPITLMSSGTVGQSSANGALRRARSSTPTTTGQSPLLSAIPQHSPLLSIQTGGIGMLSNLPVPTPLSIPSPTLSITRAGAGGYLAANGSAASKTLAGFSTHSNSSNGGAGVGTKWQAVGSGNKETGSAPADSPTSTRPSTPTNAVLPSSFYGAGPSPSVLSSSAGKAATPTTAAGTGANGGSGPGYGSGALGLSLGSGSRRFKEEQEEQEEQEDMLDDVNAIRLGEM